MTRAEFFGSPDQQAVLKRGHALYQLMKDRPEVSYYGRGVGVLRPDAAGLGTLDHLLAVQGVSNIGLVPNDGREALASDLEAKGYAITTYAYWEGAETAIVTARDILADYALPEDVTVTLIDTDTNPQDLADLAKVALGAGVLPIAGPVLRGRTRPGLGVVATDASGKPVSCAASAAFAHPDDPDVGSTAWWGMLATDESRKGQRLALILGAIALTAMHERHGFSRFFTGVVPGNAPSEAVCRKTGLSHGDYSILTIVDPTALAGGKLTK